MVPLWLGSGLSSAGGSVQDSYCYQIFLDQNHSLVLPTVQQLLEHSFHSAKLKLAEVSGWCRKGGGGFW